jgi:predicted metal-dependent phosphoesterase TrpH
MPFAFNKQLSTDTQTQSLDRVNFQLPDIKALKASATVVDMHFHSRYSDGSNDIPSIAARVRKLGIGIAITDHNAIGGALEMARYRDIFSIPGIEITSREGAHLLVYFYQTSELVRFYEKELKHFLGKEVMSSCALSMESLIACARQYHCVVVFPHPFSAAYVGVCNPLFSPSRQKYLFSAVDGIEAVNAGNLHKWNLESTVLGFNLDTGLTGGSDGHSLFQMGRAVTFASCPKDRAAFLDSLRDRATRVVGKEVNLFRKVTSNSMKLRSNIRNSSDLFGKNMRYGYAVINRRSGWIKRLRNQS